MKKNYFFRLTLSLLGVFSLFIANGQTTFNSTGAIQYYTVPVGVSSIQIEAAGAQGGASGGMGATMQGDFSVTPGETLTIIVGQEGFLQVGGNSQNSAGGGGGSFVYDASNTLFLAAGGGGGKCPYTGSVPLHAGAHGQVGTDGGNNSDGTQFGGTAGNGGQEGIWSGTACAGGGTGWLSPGGGGVLGGKDAAGNWIGGDPYCAGGGGGCGGFGGFGGGGGAGNLYGGGGGGGGYSGGAGGNDPDHGGGGGSYNNGLNQVNAGGVNTGNGYIIITELCAPLTVTVSSSTVCDGDMVTLDASSTGSGVVTWDNGVVSGVPFTPTVGTTTYTATSTDGNDCGYAVDITVNALPTVIGSVNNSTVCLDDSIILTGSGADMYVWDNGAVDGVEFAPGSAGLTQYTVTGTDANGCENTDIVDVQVNQLDFTAVITNETLGADGAIDLTVSGGTGTNTFAWSSGQITEDISGLTPGNYTVSVDDGVCTGDTTFTIINVLGVNNNSLTTLEVYPNPTNGFVTIKLNGTFNYSVLNVLGEVIISGQGNNSSQINLSEYNRGAYFISIKSDDVNETLKIIKR